MKALKVNFAPRRRLPVWCWYLPGALVFGIAAQQGWQAWRLREQTELLRAESVRLSAQIDQARVAAQRPVSPPLYAKDAAEIARVASFPLNAVLTAVESARVQTVKMTSLEISAGEYAVRAGLEFGDYNALAEYLEAINAGEARARWHLVQAQLGSSGAPNTATIASRWE
ncbi:MAG TPA: hypothetical protein VFP68_20215 [Burkholderiaceae bacterium]|nr:hypothetical protein [Burkholderiaceae bacterium]